MGNITLYSVGDEMIELPNNLKMDSNLILNDQSQVMVKNFYIDIDGP